MNATPAIPSMRELNVITARYQNPSWFRAGMQVLVTFLPMAALWFAVSQLGEQNLFACLGLGVLIGLLQVRICMFQHDCGHQSFLPTIASNDAAGQLFQLFSLMPYFKWRHEHAIHHAGTGNLAKRGTGDVDTLTVREYRALTPGKRLGYRVYRNTLVLLGIAPIWQFMLRQRWPEFSQGKREVRGVFWLDLMLVAYGLAMSAWLGPTVFLATQFIASFVMASVSIFTFYVQHQYETTYWRPQESWDYSHGALLGSSLHVIPKWMQWITSNIGIHHIHHLSPRIPNYELQRCLDENEVFQQANRITFMQSFATFGLKLWDEESLRLVSFRAAEEPVRGGESQAVA